MVGFPNLAIPNLAVKIRQGGRMYLCIVVNVAAQLSHEVANPILRHCV